MRKKKIEHCKDLEAAVDSWGVAWYDGIPYTRASTNSVKIYSEVKELRERVASYEDKFTKLVLSSQIMAAVAVSFLAYRVLGFLGRYRIRRVS